MFDFRAAGPRVWPSDLRPTADESHAKEPFAAWWERHEGAIGHLHPKLVEQWIYRHWRHTEFAFLPLETLTWELAEMEGEEILTHIRREISKRVDPEWDYDQFQGTHGAGKTATAEDLDRGTWEYPIVALFTPTGWVTRSEMHPHDFIALPDERLMLLEGHQRHRYLNALHWRGTPPKGPHRVFIVKSPAVS